MSFGVENLKAELRATLPDPLPPKMGVAVSGGGDSTALLHLLVEILQGTGTTLYCATVDHGLRSESADEAVRVADACANLGVHHEVLTWESWDRTGNLQDQARKARYRLLERWAKGHNFEVIALGHTADDQAETVLMRLARSAGVTGLSAMSTQRRRNGICFLRPLLGVTREYLREYLRSIGATWIDDPSNRNTRFDRIKARNALDGLASIGITANTLARVAENLSHADEALRRYAHDAARGIATVEDGDVLIDRQRLIALPQEIRRRILLAAIHWIAGRGYPPRQSSMDLALDTISKGTTGTIGGCLLIPQAEKVRVCRELNAVKSEFSTTGELWDGRWIISAPQTEGTQIRALGEDGIRQLEDWRSAAKPRAALLATPAVWAGTTLLAAPLAGYPNGSRAILAPDAPEFHALLLSH